MRRLAMLCLLLASCGFHRHADTDYAELYDRAAQEHHRELRAVIVIPGILGSKLTDTRSGQSVWGRSRSNPTRETLALPIGADPNNITSPVQPDGVLESLDISILGVPVHLRAYAGILRTLGAGGYTDPAFAPGGQDVDWGEEHFTCFQFDYDWRLSCVQNAARLDEFIGQREAAILSHAREKYGISRSKVRFDIVAHSMGCLVARYYARYGRQPLPANGLPRLTWSGADKIRRLILIAPPNAGSVSAFTELIRGKKFLPRWQRRALGVSIPEFPAEVLGTYPSLYELMPRSRHGAVLDSETKSPIDLYAPALWKQYRWGVSQHSAHLSRLLGHASRFHRALDRAASPPPHMTVHAFIGDAIQTPRVIRLDRATGTLSDHDYDAGDGIVARSSALLDERLDSSQTWTAKLRSPLSYDSVHFLASDHVEITRSPTFKDNLLYLLLEAPEAPAKRR